MLNNRLGPDMSAFFIHAVSFPTVVFTILVGLSLLYWAFVLLSGGMNSPGEGFGDELAEGGLDGWIASSTILGWLGFGKIPIAILLSFWSLAAWVVCYVSSRLLESYLPSGILSNGVEVGLTFLSAVVTAPLIRVVSSRLSPFFHSDSAEARHDLMGRTCRVSTGYVDMEFGQARLEEGGDWRVIQVRCPRPNHLQRNDEALIIAWDVTLDAFRVEQIKIPSS